MDGKLFSKVLLWVAMAFCIQGQAIPWNCRRLFSAVVEQVRRDYRSDPRFIAHSGSQRIQLVDFIAQHRIARTQLQQLEREQDFLEQLVARHERHGREIEWEWYSHNIGFITQEAWNGEITRLLRENSVNFPLRKYFNGRAAIDIKGVKTVIEYLAIMNAIQNHRVAVVENLLELMLDGVEYGPLAIHTAANRSVDIENDSPLDTSLQIGHLMGRSIIYLPDAAAEETMAATHRVVGISEIPADIREFVRNQKEFLENLRIPPTNAHRDLLHLLHNSFSLQSR